MSSFERFMKKNKKVKKNLRIVATKSLTDEKGTPLEWEIRPLTSTEDDEIRYECTKDVPVTGKPNQYRSKTDIPKYLAMATSSCVVYPDLRDKDLQDSYGVTKPEALLKEMIDDPGEYQDFLAAVQKFNGFDIPIDEEVEEAKN